MHVSELKKRIKQLEHLIAQPNQSASVKADLRKEVIRLEEQFKNVKRCLFGKTFADKV